MRKFNLITGFLLVLVLSSIVIPANFDGSGTATGTMKRNSQNHARVGPSKSRIGKVTVTRVIVTDIFGHEREVAFKVVGGAGTSRPTVKFVGENLPKKDEFVTVEFTTTVDGDFGPLDLHLY